METKPLDVRSFTVRHIQISLNTCVYKNRQIKKQLYESLDIESDPRRVRERNSTSPVIVTGPGQAVGSAERFWWLLVVYRCSTTVFDPCMVSSPLRHDPSLKPDLLEQTFHPMEHRGALTTRHFLLELQLPVSVAATFTVSVWCLSDFSSFWTFEGQMSHRSFFWSNPCSCPMLLVRLCWAGP